MHFFQISAFIAVLLCATLLVEAKKGDHESSRSFCIQNATVTEAEVNAAEAVKYMNASPKVQCYIECKLKQQGAIKNGQVDTPTVTSFLTKRGRMSAADATAAVNKCKGEMKGTECAPAYNFGQCIFGSMGSKRSSKV